MSTKRAYKLIKSEERKSKYTSEATELIHFLINLHSWFPACYYDQEDKKQLRYILAGNKSWHGDVRFYFIRKYRAYIYQQRRVIERTGSRYEPGKVQTNELPF